MRRTSTSITKRRISPATVQFADATVALLDQDTYVDENEPAIYNRSARADALRDWPEIAGDVDEWVKERGGRGDEGRYA